VPAIRIAISQGSRGVTGMRTLTAIPVVSETMSGRDMPNRSDRRPATGDSTDSMRAPHKNVAAITVPDAPSRESRSGARTSIKPKAMPASAISHMPMATW